jgi:N-acetylneuraminate synthase
MEPAELESLVLESERAWSALGNIAYGPTEKEKSSLQFRRSLYITQDMQAGDILTSKNLRTIRPGFGLPPKYYNQLLGCEVNTDITRGTPVSWKIVK